MCEPFDFEHKIVNRSMKTMYIILIIEVFHNSLEPTLYIYIKITDSLHRV